MKSSFLKNLSGIKTKDIPFWYMRQAGRYLPEYRDVRNDAGGFLDLCFNPELAAEVSLQPVRRFDVSAAIVFADILLVPLALGQKVTFEKSDGPQLEPFDGLKLNSNNILEQLDSVANTITVIKSKLGKDKNIIGFAGAPWTVAAYMIEGKGSKDFHKSRVFALNHRSEFLNLLDILTEVTAEYLIMQIRAGADTVQIFDSWAGLLSEKECREYVIKPTAKIVKIIHDQYPEIPIIGFPKGLQAMLLDYCDETGINAVSIDSSIPMQWAIKKIPSNICIQGNLDPLTLLSDNTDIIFDNVQDILEHTRERPFVFNLGHGIHKDTKPENILNLSNYIKDWKI